MTKQETLNFINKLFNKQSQDEMLSPIAYRSSKTNFDGAEMVLEGINNFISWLFDNFEFENSRIVGASYVDTYNHHYPAYEDYAISEKAFTFCFVQSYKQINTKEEPKEIFLRKIFFQFDSSMIIMRDSNAEEANTPLDHNFENHVDLYQLATQDKYQNREKDNDYMEFYFKSIEYFKQRVGKYLNCYPLSSTACINQIQENDRYF